MTAEVATEEMTAEAEAKEEVVVKEEAARVADKEEVVEDKPSPVM